MNWPWRIYHLRVEPGKVWFHFRVPAAVFMKWCERSPDAVGNILNAIQKARLRSVPPEIQQLISAGSPEAFNRYAREIRLRFCREYEFPEEESTADGHCFCGLRQGGDKLSIEFKTTRPVSYLVCYHGVLVNCAGRWFGTLKPKLFPTLVWKVVNRLMKKRVKTE